jgi:hypothetical protein
VVQVRGEIGRSGVHVGDRLEETRILIAFAFAMVVLASVMLALTGW